MSLPRFVALVLGLGLVVLASPAWSRDVTGIVTVSIEAREVPGRGLVWVVDALPHPDAPAAIDAE